MKKAIWTALCTVCLLLGLALPALAADLGEPNITTQTTMRELRENSSIKGSGYYTYSNEWSEEDPRWMDSTIEDYVGAAEAQDVVSAMNLVINNYNRGVQITWQVYSPEEIAENVRLGMVQLYYFPANTANAKFAIVVPGNGGFTTSELGEGGSMAWQLHEAGYAVFVLRYRSFMEATDNAPVQDIGNAVRYVINHAAQFEVQPEDYALVGFSSGGQIVGLIGSDSKEFGYQAFGIPQPAALLLGYPINDFAEVKPVYHVVIDPTAFGWRYYWTNISDVVNANYTPVFFWYGKNDVYMKRMGFCLQGPTLQRALEASGATYKCLVFENAPHAIGTGRGTDAEGWVQQAVAFWEEQVARRHS